MPTISTCAQCSRLIENLRPSVVIITVGTSRLPDHLQQSCFDGAPIAGEVDGGDSHRVRWHAVFVVKVVVIDRGVEQHAFGVDVMGMRGRVAFGDGPVRAYGALCDIAVELVHVGGMKLIVRDPA